MHNIIKFQAWADLHVNFLYHERGPLLIFTVGPKIGAISSLTSDTKFVKILFSVGSTIWGNILIEHYFFQEKLSYIFV